MSFDLLAPHYRWMEALLAGGKLQACRTALLADVRAPRSILLMGEGHGRALVACAVRFPDACIVCLDASAGMLEEARRRLERSGGDAHRVEFVHADALAWEPNRRTFDLVVTNFFLDCFRPDQLERLIDRIAAHMVDGADWLLADFQLPRGRLKRLRGWVILRAMYAFFRVVTRLPARHLTAPDPFLERAGFILCRREESEWGLLHSDRWRLRRPERTVGRR